MVTLRPFRSQVLARMKAPLQTDMVYWVWAWICVMKLRVRSCLPAASTPPPGITNPSGCGASAKVREGRMMGPIEEGGCDVRLP